MDDARSYVIENPRLEGGNVTVDRQHPKTPSFQSIPFRMRLGWRLRCLADWIDRGRSYRVSGMWPTGMTDRDLFDALCHAMAAMQEYMTDLQEERRVG